MAFKQQDTGAVYSCDQCGNSIEMPKGKGRPPTWLGASFHIGNTALHTDIDWCENCLDDVRTTMATHGVNVAKP